MSDGAGCDDGNPCTQSSSCQGGICTGGSPLACTDPGECEQLPGTCNEQNGACESAPMSNGSPCGGEIGGRVCCEGGCCDEGASCGPGGCQTACAPLGQPCGDEAECCQDGVTGCNDNCCHFLFESCTDNSECCSFRCNGAFCCAPPGGECTSEGDCCTGQLGDCDFGVCRCRQVGESCDSSPECCGFDTCVAGECAAGVCLLLQSPCRDDFECCDDGGTTHCLDVANCGGADSTQCCLFTGGSCASDCDCCGDDICENDTCCRDTGDGCAFGHECCSGTCCDGVCCAAGLSCIGDICRESCPLGAFPCGPTGCCGFHEHCVDGGCTCVPLRGECDPENNLCCQNGETQCHPLGLSGIVDNQCCHPTGGACDPEHDRGPGTSSDCCVNSYAFTGAIWIGPCGFGGVCGGPGAVCGTDANCVSGQCRGHCNNQAPVRPCIPANFGAECDCDTDEEDFQCVRPSGACIDVRCD